MPNPVPKPVRYRGYSIVKSRRSDDYEIRVLRGDTLVSFADTIELAKATIDDWQNAR